MPKIVRQRAGVSHRWRACSRSNAEACAGARGSRVKSSMFCTAKYIKYPGTPATHSASSVPSSSQPPHVGRNPPRPTRSLDARVSSAKFTVKKLLLTGIAAGLLMAQAPRAGVTVLQDQPGGFLDRYKRLFEALEASGNNVEIRGKCLSACTLVLSYIPKERLCFHETAWLGFHLAGSFYGASTEVSQAMFDSYPQDIRKWLQQKGGLEKMPHGAGFWAILAPELWKIGYRKCEGTTP